MGFRGGGVKLIPPQRILVFKYPSGDRVNVYKNNTGQIFLAKIGESFPLDGEQLNPVMVPNTFVIMLGSSNKGIKEKLQLKYL